MSYKVKLIESIKSKEKMTTEEFNLPQNLLIKGSAARDIKVFIN